VPACAPVTLRRRQSGCCLEGWSSNPFIVYAYANLSLSGPNRRFTNAAGKSIEVHLTSLTQWSDKICTTGFQIFFTAAVVPTSWLPLAAVTISSMSVLLSITSSFGTGLT
jgi:hypothetical protein